MNQAAPAQYIRYRLNTGTLSLAKSAVFLLPGNYNPITSVTGTAEGGSIKFKLNKDRMYA